MSRRSLPPAVLTIDLKTCFLSQKQTSNDENQNYSESIKKASNL